jgi:hypothetical protein
MNYNDHQKFVVYMIVYFGNNLPKKSKTSKKKPRRYIGSAKASNIYSGYLGSVSSKKYSEIWKKEIIENRSAFKIKILSFHDTDLEAREEEKRLHIKYDVVKSDLYVNLAIASPNGYFGSPDTGRIFSEETKLKMSNIRKGKTYEEIFGPEKAKEMIEKRKKQTPHNKGKTGSCLSEDTKQKMRNKIFITNGIIDRKIDTNECIPFGWTRGRTNGGSNSENTSFKREDVKIKAKKTKLEKYGCENYTNPNKKKETCLEKYGVDHYSKTKKHTTEVSNRNIEKGNREIVAKIKHLQKKYNIKLKSGWYLKSDLELEYIFNLIMSENQLRTNVIDDEALVTAV